MIVLSWLYTLIYVNWKQCKKLPISWIWGEFWSRSWSYKQLKSGKRIFDNILTYFFNKRSGIKISAKLVKYVMQYVVIIKHKIFMGHRIVNRESVKNKIHPLRQRKLILCRWSLVRACRNQLFFTYLRILTGDPKVPNAKILELVPSQVSGAGFSSHSAVFTA